MPLEFTDDTASDFKQAEQDLTNYRDNLATQEDLKHYSYNNEPWYSQLGKGAFHGPLAAAESAMNLPSDLVGESERFWTFSDVIYPRESLWFTVPSTVTQFAASWIGVGKFKKIGDLLASGGKAITKKLSKAEAIQQEKVLKGSLGKDIVRIGSQGAVRGMFAEGIGFRGQDEASMLVGLANFISEHPEIEDEVNRITSIPGWHENSTSQNAEDLRSRLEISLYNVKGRGIYAIEGAALGAVCNWIMAGIGYAWRSAKGETDAALREFAVVGDPSMEEAANITSLQEAKIASDRLEKQGGPKESMDSEEARRMSTVSSEGDIDYDHVSPERAKKLSKSEEQTLTKQTESERLTAERRTGAAAQEMAENEVALAETVSNLSKTSKGINNAPINETGIVPPETDTEIINDIVGDRAGKPMSDSAPEADQIPEIVELRNPKVEGEVVGVKTELEKQPDPAKQEAPYNRINRPKEDRGTVDKDKKSIKSDATDTEVRTRVVHQGDDQIIIVDENGKTQLIDSPLKSDVPSSIQKLKKDRATEPASYSIEEQGVPVYGPIHAIIEDGIFKVWVHKDEAKILWDQIKNGEINKISKNLDYNTEVHKTLKIALHDEDQFVDFLISHERSKLKFPRFEKEKIKAYKKRIALHAVQDMKKRGVGDWFKVEFSGTSKGGKYLVFDRNKQFAVLFQKNAQEAKALFDQLLTGKLDFRKAMERVSQLINVDTTFSDLGHRYFMGRLMVFFAKELRIAVKTRSQEDTAETLAKAAQWIGSKPAERKGPREILNQREKLDEIASAANEIGAANATGSRETLERLRSGRGDFKGMFDNMKHLTDDVAVTDELYVRIWAYRIDQAVSVRKLQKLVDDISKLGDADVPLEKWAELDFHLNSLEWKIHQFQKLRTSSGRILQAHQAFHKQISSEVMGDKQTRAAIQKAVDGRGNTRQLKTITEKLNAVFKGNEDDPFAAAASAKSLLAKQVYGVDIHNEYWLNSILSGTRTLVVNALSAGLHMYWVPFERMMGALWTKDRQSAAIFARDMVYTAMLTKEVFKTMYALGWNNLKHLGGARKSSEFHAARADIFEKGDPYKYGRRHGGSAQGIAAMASARMAQRKGSGMLDTSYNLFDLSDKRAITKGIVDESTKQMELGGMRVGEWLSSVVDYMGTVIRTPARFLTGTDELFKQITYRATVMSRFAQEAFENPSVLEPYYKSAVGRPGSKITEDMLAVGIEKRMPDKDVLAEYVADRFYGMIREDGRRYTKDAILDEAWKIYKKAFDAANNSHKNLPDQFKDRDKFLFDYVSKNYDSKKSTISDSAMDTAGEVTFTRDLNADLKFLKTKYQDNPNSVPFGSYYAKKTNTIGGWAQDFVTDHPAMKALMPFIRTPVNLLLWAGKRLPLVHPEGVIGKRFKFVQRMHHQYQADMLSGDPLRAAAAEGRLMTAQASFVTILGLTTGGFVTGGGPVNQRKRKLKMATGWRPYSFRLGERYISYARLDPFSTTLGVVADFVEKTEVGARTGDIDEGTVTAVGGAIIYSLSANFANKSYLAGLTDVLTAITEPEQKLEAFLVKRGASYIPKASSQFVPVTDDPFMRQPYGLVEAMASRIPYAASSIDKTRNILGQPIEAMEPATAPFSIINPFLISKIKNNFVLDTLAALDYGFGAPQPRIKGSKFLDMREFRDGKGRTAYDFFQEQVGKIKLSGKTLEQRLSDYFRSDLFYRGSLLADQWDVAGNDPRIKRVKSLLNTYRTSAKRKTIDTYPELKSAINVHNKDIFRKLSTIVFGEGVSN